MIRVDVIAKSVAAMTPVLRTTAGRIGDALTRASAADHSAAPAPKIGALAVKSIPEADTIKVWPATKTRKPAASSALPRCR